MSFYNFIGGFGLREALVVQREHHVHFLLSACPDVVTLLWGVVYGGTAALRLASRPHSRRGHWISIRFTPYTLYPTPYTLHVVQREHLVHFPPPV